MKYGIAGAAGLFGPTGGGVRFLEKRTGSVPGGAGGLFAGNCLGANAVAGILVSGRIAGESAAAGR